MGGLEFVRFVRGSDFFVCVAVDWGRDSGGQGSPETPDDDSIKFQRMVR